MVKIFMAYLNVVITYIKNFCVTPTFFSDLFKKTLNFCLPADRNGSEVGANSSEFVLAGMFFTPAGMFFSLAGMFFQQKNMFFRQAGMFFYRAGMFFQENGLPAAPTSDEFGANKLPAKTIMI